jgi:hypothetical protein
MLTSSRELPEWRPSRRQAFGGLSVRSYMDSNCSTLNGGFVEVEEVVEGIWPYKHTSRDIMRETMMEKPTIEEVDWRCLGGESVTIRDKQPL